MKAIKVFIIYSRNDSELKSELVNHLIPLERNGVLTVWNDDKILPGENWENEILKSISDADLILPLVSANFFASQYIDKVEMRKAVTKHHIGEVKLLPIVIKPCLWQSDTLFGVLQVLPKDGNPVDGGTWKNKDEAWFNVVRDIEKVLFKDKSNSEKNKTDNNKLLPPPPPPPPNIVNNNFEENNILIPSVPFVVNNEEEIWRLVISSHDENLLKKYITEYPSGKYTSIAIDMAKSDAFGLLKKQKHILDEEELLYMKCKKEDTIESYSIYLQKYPIGRFVKEAEGRKMEIIKIIKEDALEDNLLKKAFESPNILNYRNYIENSPFKYHMHKNHELYKNNSEHFRQIIKIKESQNQIIDWEKIQQDAKINSLEGFIEKYYSLGDKDITRKAQILLKEKKGAFHDIKVKYNKYRYLYRFYFYVFFIANVILASIYLLNLSAGVLKDHTTLEKLLRVGAIFIVFGISVGMLSAMQEDTNDRGYYIFRFFRKRFYLIILVIILTIASFYYSFTNILAISCIILIHERQMKSNKLIDAEF